MGLEFLVGDDFFGHLGRLRRGREGLRCRGSDEVRVEWWVPDVWEQEKATNHMKRYSFKSHTILFSVR